MQAYVNLCAALDKYVEVSPRIRLLAINRASSCTQNWSQPDPSRSPKGRAAGADGAVVQ